MSQYEEKTLHACPGLLCYKWPVKVLVQIHFKQNVDGSVTLQSLSGHNLTTLKYVHPVTISREAYLDRPVDPYDSLVEAKWALHKAGWAICGLDEIDEEEGV